MTSFPFFLYQYNYKLAKLSLCSILCGSLLRDVLNPKNTTFSDKDGMAAIGTLGRIEEFDDATDWDQYVEHLQNFFLANDINNAAKQRAVFLSVVEAGTYKTLSLRGSRLIE